MKKVGFIGWRGMVGSVLMERMQNEKDFAQFEAIYFSTSQQGQPGPDWAAGTKLLDAYDINKLKQMDIILSCQGSEYTEKVYPQLKEQNYKGYWIDAASALRMKKETMICLDPINGDDLKEGIAAGVKSFIGSNCTVGLMLLGVGALIRAGLVDWITSQTYQSASGAGARHMREYLMQMELLGHLTKDMVVNPQAGILEIDRMVSGILRGHMIPVENFGVPLASNFIPWIDSPMDNGQTREEWKGMTEANKILGNNELRVDGTCVRVGAMRCHGQALTIKLKQDIPLPEIEDRLAKAHEWVQLVPNEKINTVQQLTPAAVAGTLGIHIGRIRKMNLGNEYLNVFTVGDQLLWGAAEPLRRMLLTLIHEKKGLQ